MTQHSAKFAVGQLVRHKLFDYRGVVVDVDPVFDHSDEWYEVMARSRPPKDQPWYSVLPAGAHHRTYVAERNLEVDDGAEPIDHPEIDHFFESFADGAYRPRGRAN